VATVAPGGAVLSPTGQELGAPACDNRTVGPASNAPVVDPNLPFEDQVLQLLNLQLATLQQLAVLLSPAVNSRILDITLTVDGPTTLLPQVPSTLTFWAIKNLGANPITVWFINTGSTVPTQNFVTLEAGEYRAYATQPNGGIFCARTPGMSTQLQFEFWF